MDVAFSIRSYKKRNNNVGLRKRNPDPGRSKSALGKKVYFGKKWRIEDRARCWELGLKYVQY